MFNKQNFVFLGLFMHRFRCVILIRYQFPSDRVNPYYFKALNDDLQSKFDDRINSTDNQLLDCPNNDPDAILRIMFSERHISVNDLVSAIYPIIKFW